MTRTMLEPTSSAPAPAWLHALTTARTLYEELHGWPVTLDVTARRLVMLIGTRLDAVAMPSWLGRQVLADLRIAMLSGPVIMGPGGGRWTFLTELADATSHDIRAELHSFDVHFIPRGVRVVVPTHQGARNARWRWVESPLPRHPLPPWPAVAATVSRVLNRASRDRARC